MIPSTPQSAESHTSNRIPHVMVTAYGVTSCIGGGIESLRNALVQGLTGLTENPTLPDSVGSIAFTACVGVVPEIISEAPLRDRFQPTRQLQISWQTAQQIDEAVRKSTLRWGKERVGIVLGTSTGAILATELALLSHRDTGKLPLGYSCENGHAMDAAARYLAASWEIKGPTFAVSAACASGAKALATAKRMIESGVCDAVVAGGIDSLCRMTLHGFHSLGVLSSEPCSPFDHASSDGPRYGMNVAEGGSLLLLEREHENASNLGYLVGIGESSDAYHMSAPDPEGRGQSLAMLRALEDAGIQGSQIDYLNAHGTGTQANDEAEAIAVRAVLPDCPASSSKGIVGHQLGAAGSTEAIIALEVLGGLAIGPQGAIKPEQFPLKDGVRHWVQSNSFAFGGANISLVFGKLPAATQKAAKPSLENTAYWIESAVSSQDLETSESSWGQALLPARAKARAGTLTRLCAELASHCGLSKEQLSTTPVVFSSALGQLQITRKLIGLFLEGDSSPLAFQNSVHNSVFGTLSLALSNREASSSLAAGKDSTFYALLEACSLLWASPVAERVLVICADEAPPPELELAHTQTAGAAFVISREATNGVAKLEFKPGSGELHHSLAPDQNSEAHEHLRIHGIALSSYIKSATSSYMNSSSSPFSKNAEHQPIGLSAQDDVGYFLVTPLSGGNSHNNVSSPSHENRHHGVADAN